jgi:hypothetical protein
MEREPGFQGTPGESRVKGPVLREPSSQPEFAQTQLPKVQPGVPPRGKRQRPKKRQTLAEESLKMLAQSATRRKNKEEP